MRRLASVLLLFLAISGCRQSERRPIVGVVPKGANHIFWQTVHAGANKAASEYGLDVEWNAPTLEVDSSRQISIVDSMVNRRLAGIALAPVDRTGLVGVVERAASAGIPVAIFDSGVDTAKRLTYIATDNREGGKLAARHLGQLLGGKGEVAIIGFMPGSASTAEREDGFEEELKNSWPGITVVQKVFGMADRAKSRAATENILTAHPKLRGIFADNESSSAGAMMALKARDTSTVHMVAFDSNEQLISELKSSRIDALVLQDPFRMGYESVKAIGMKLKGEKPPERIDSGVYLVTGSDLQKPDVVKLLNPDLKTWLTPNSGH